MSVLIVESPAKCKTIGKYLGSNFQILSSYGHVRGLPSKKGSVLPDEDFRMIYEIHDDAKKHIAELVKAVKSTDKLYLATDPDREGEAISWHVVEVLRAKRAIKKSTIVHRITFNEITKTAVLSAIKNPRNIDMNLVQAQQARQALDYLVGFTLSPLLWKKLPGSRSAGRVQSVALRIICERENEIKKFKSEEYWKIIAELNHSQPFQALLFEVEGKKLEKLSIKNEVQAKKITKNLVDKQCEVIRVEKKEVKRNPLPPFITSTLQQDAANKLGFTTKRTMMVAQKLYEGIKIGKEEVGLITYMRTDGLYVNSNFIAATRNMIKNDFGDEYLPKLLRKYQSKAKNSQEAHEAIRPTNIDLTPGKAEKYLTEEQLKLYKLIWNRMVASQMEPAVLSKVSIDFVSSDKYALLRSTGSTIKFDGFYKIYRSDSNEDEEGELLPNIKEGEVYNVKKVLPTQHFTQPPPRFTEASLVKKMEELGIGRPSTYAMIISVLQDRKYVVLEKKKFIPEDRGQFVTAFLLSFFRRYVEYDFTAGLEGSLDKVSNHDLDLKDVLRDFWQLFIANVQEVEKQEIPKILCEIDKLLEIYVFPEDEEGNINRDCLKCNNGKLNLNIGKFGPFVSCSSYPGCDYRRSIFGSATGQEAVEPRCLGVNPNSEEKVLIKQGPYGFYLQCGSKKSVIPKGLDLLKISLEQAVKLLSMPCSIGRNPQNDSEVKIGVGRYGPYVLHDGKYTSLNVNRLFYIDLAEALSLIEKKNKSQILGEYKEKQIELCKGRYGPYIKYDGKNIALPKDLKKKNEIAFEEAIKLIEN
ncbi:MAG: type I DNA topoisomerase [Rickettsiaceae bacterium H1]|nr:type I DNA topoisomerase [Rickettsiaceae bacterium H1]